MTLRDGRGVRASHDAGIPSADMAAQGERLAAKFDALAEPVLGAARTRELRQAIDGLDGRADIGALARLGCPLSNRSPGESRGPLRPRQKR